MNEERKHSEPSAGELLGVVQELALAVANLHIAVMEADIGERARLSALHESAYENLKSALQKLSAMKVEELAEAGH